MTSKPECTSGAAPLAGAVRPDEKTGAGGSAPAPVPAGDAWALAKKFGRVDQFRFRVPGAMKMHDVECVVMERPDVEQFAAALSKQVPAGDAVALAAECKRLADDLVAWAACLRPNAHGTKHRISPDNLPLHMAKAEAGYGAARVALHSAIDRLAAISREGQADSTGGTTT